MSDLILDGLPIHTITRHAYMPDMGVFGRLTVAGETFYSIEPPWRDNKRSVSCVPEGRYLVSTHDTSTSVPLEFGGRTWYLESAGVAIREAQARRAADRWGIAIHKANRAAELAGCIAFGTSLWYLSGEWAVRDSGFALVRLKHLLPEKFVLDITAYRPS